MSNGYIQLTILELKRLEDLKADLGKQIKEKEDVLKEYMRTNNIEELHGMAGEKAIYREVISNRFDVKNFKNNFEGLYNSYLKRTKNLRFKFSY